MGWGDGSVVRALAALAEDLGVAPAVAVSVAGSPDTLLSLLCTPHSMAALDKCFLYFQKGLQCPDTWGFLPGHRNLHCPQLGTIWSPVLHCTNSKTPAGPREVGFV